MAEAFARRHPKFGDDGQVIDPGDDDGLSVFDSARIDQQICLRESRSCFGLASLHVGTLRDLGLMVVRHAQDARKVLIVNMPLESPATADEETLLESVAKKSRIALRQRYKQKD
jgi:hypothetical protein